MLELLSLLWSFFKIGFFTIGGGYAMIPLIQSELVSKGYMSALEVADIVAVSQMTPGPFAINAATFTGVRTAGVLGGIFATLGVMLPSFIIASILAKYFFKFYKKPIVKSTLRGIRPVVTGLIAAAAIMLMLPALFNVTSLLGLDVVAILKSIDIAAVVIAIITGIAVIGFKVSPIIMIIASGIAGVLIYAVI